MSVSRLAGGKTPVSLFRAGRTSRGALRPSSSGLLIVLSLCAVPRADAAGNADIAGEYICKVGCRVTDAAPNIEIKGPIARCMSELGGIYTGRLVSPSSVYCFNMVGTLSNDGQSIIWSNGNVWERR